MGLSCQESLLTVRESGRVLISLQNFRRSQVDLGGGLKLGCGEQLLEDGTPPEDVLSDSDLAPVTPSAQVLTVGESHLSESHWPKLCEQLNLPEGDISPGELAQLEEMLHAAEDVFALDDTELGHTSLVQHGVDTGDHPPVKQLPRRLPFSRREKVVELIDEMMAKGVVQPSTSAWASPIVLVPKRDGSLRFCVDYRKLNAITKKDVAIPPP